MNETKLDSIGGLALRNKKWDECSDVEKIEKLKTELLEMRHLVNRIMSLEESNRQMKKHQHGVNGEVLVLPSEYGHCTGIMGAVRADPLS